MKKVILIIIGLFAINMAFGQNKFRVDYNYVSAYDPKTKTWGDWQEGDNTFVININSNGDIATPKRRWRNSNIQEIVRHGRRLH